MPKLIMKELAIAEYLERFKKSRVEKEKLLSSIKK